MKALKTIPSEEKMEHEKINKLIEENMKNIFGYSLSRLQNREAADELSSDIIYEILKSAPKLSDDSRFYAFMWRIAENKYADHLRKKYKHKCTYLDENLADESTVEEDIILNEDLKLLHRELSLLSEQYRRSMVMYYIEGRTCSQISQKLKISTEMVKYYLFLARKLVREGMNMERIYGEKSYNPKNFEIDFWGTKGGADAEYRDFKKRKIKGNILLAAYYSPLNLQELSMELGVAAPYLEDEINILLKREYLIEKNGKYIANIPIFTKECTEEIEKRLAPAIKSAADDVISASYEEFKREFGHKFEDEAAMRWQIAMLCCRIASLSEKSDCDLPSDGPYRLVNGGGGRGFIWGRSEHNSENGIEGIYNGMHSRDSRGWIVAFNFKQTLCVQHFMGSRSDFVVAVALDGFDALPEESKKLMEKEGYIKDGKANFPVYTKEEFEKANKLLADMAGIFKKVDSQTVKIASEVTTDHSPEHIRKTAAMVGAFTYGFQSAEKLVTSLYEKSWLLPVNGSQKCSMCVVKM